MWELREYLKRVHGITTAVQLQACIEATVGIIVAVQTLRALLRGPLAPRREMIQLLCDVFNCRSDAFYLVTPNPERVKQWEKNRLEGKKPSALYQTTGSLEEIVAAHPDSNPAEKPKCLRATFTDPRLFYKRRLAGRTNELAANQS
jgi:hypothetical protein